MLKKELLLKKCICSSASTNFVQCLCDYFSVAGTRFDPCSNGGHWAAHLCPILGMAAQQRVCFPSRLHPVGENGRHVQLLHRTHEYRWAGRPTDHGMPEINGGSAARIAARAGPVPRAEPHGPRPLRLYCSAEHLPRSRYDKWRKINSKEFCEYVSDINLVAIIKQNINP